MIHVLNLAVSALLARFCKHTFVEYDYAVLLALETKSLSYFFARGA